MLHVDRDAPQLELCWDQSFAGLHCHSKGCSAPPFSRAARLSRPRKSPFCDECQLSSTSVNRGRLSRYACCTCTVGV